MSTSIAKVQSELESIGYTTRLFDSRQGIVVSFDYIIEAGSHKGRQVKIGVSFQEDGYPEYPPHWIHVSPPLDDGKGGAIEQYNDAEGRQWLAMSRAPSDIWDNLPTKHMSVYLREHLRRIWKDI